MGGSLAKFGEEKLRARLKSALANFFFRDANPNGDGTGNRHAS